MPKKTLLNLTKDIALLSDEMEPLDVISDDLGITLARMVKTAFEGMVLEYNIGEHEAVIPLDGLSDLTKPNYMRVPTGTKRVHRVLYDISDVTDAGRRRWKDIPYVDVDEFISRTKGRDNTESTIIDVTTFGGITLPIYNDRPPGYYTTIDDEHLIFDAYDSAEDTTLQSTKSQAHVLTEPVFQTTDAFVPPLPENLFPVLESNALALYYGTYLQSDMPPELRRHMRNMRINAEKQFRMKTPQNRTRKYGR